MMVGVVTVSRGLTLCPPPRACLPPTIAGWSYLEKFRGYQLPWKRQLGVQASFTARPSRWEAACQPHLLLGAISSLLNHSFSQSFFILLCPGSGAHVRNVVSAASVPEQD
jgi:hypothetical protein